MAEIGDLIKLVQEFRDARDWKQFHNPKDLAISLTLEATEVLEHFQWKTKEEMDEYVKSHKTEIGEELCLGLKMSPKSHIQALLNLQLQRI